MNVQRDFQDLKIKLLNFTDESLLKCLCGNPNIKEAKLRFSEIEPI